MAMVLVNSKVYEMTGEEARKMRNMAGEYVPRGIYAVQKGDKIELRKDTFTDKQAMKTAIKKWNKNGFIAFFNWKR